MKNIRNEAEDTLQSTERRSFLRGAGMSGLAMAGAAVLGGGERAVAQASTGLTATDIAVFNFALNLEYLEAEFYTKAFYGKTIEQMGIAVDGVGNSGPTIGGQEVDFEVLDNKFGFPTDKMEFSGRLRAVVKQITIDEQTHVKLLRSLLGKNAIAKPTINLDATDGFSNFKKFLNQARDFEDVGVSAYGGAATLLSTTGLSYGARIALVEAYHASTLRFLVAENKVQSPAIDALDVPPPPTGDSYFTVDSNALAIVRTTSQVLAIVYNGAAPGTDYGGFFPRGVNGAITTV